MLFLSGDVVLFVSGDGLLVSGDVVMCCLSVAMWW